MKNPLEKKSQYRFDPFLQEWVVYAPSRNKRPFQGKKFTEETEKRSWSCPFCPDAPEGAGDWIVKQLPNKFASLDEEASPFKERIFGNSFNYKSAPNFGKCEVILYSQNHHASFGNLDLSNIVALIDLWSERYHVLSTLSQIKYPFIMENRGKEVGNSMVHPHGQIYAFPFLPTAIKKEFASIQSYYHENSSCLLCDIIKEELSDKSRIIEENAHFIAEIPFYAHWSFEVHIIPKKHLSSIDQLNQQEKSSLAEIMRNVVRRYDLLYGKDPFMPYVMAMHNAPVNVQSSDLWHFHIEYYTPYRGPDKWKYLAGVELGTQTFISDALPEENAKIMRDLQI